VSEYSVAEEEDKKWREIRRNQWRERRREEDREENGTVKSNCIKLGEDPRKRRF
jgi:hypothetical protein